MCPCREPAHQEAKRTFVAPRLSSLGLVLLLANAHPVALAAELHHDDVEALERQYMHPRAGCTIAHVVYDIKGECVAFSQSKSSTSDH